MRRNWDWLLVAFIGAVTAVVCIAKAHSLNVQRPTNWSNAAVEHYNRASGEQNGWFIAGIFGLAILGYAFIRINDRRKRNQRLANARPMQHKKSISSVDRYGARPVRPNGELSRRFADHTNMPAPTSLSDFAVKRPMPTRNRSHRQD